MSKKQPLSELIGAKFHLLTILNEAPTNNPKHRKVTAQCECGIIKDYFLGNLKRGLTHSCGCHNLSLVGEKKHTFKHGLKSHPLYGVWSGMKDRCYNTNCKAYYLYGGDGVIVCDEWKDNFKAFYDWAMKNGWENRLEIDKDILGNGKLYSPETCSFVTEKENCNKRRTSKYLTFKGEIKTVAQWSDLTGLSQQVIYKRMKKGWSIEKSLTVPLIPNTPSLSLAQANEIREDYIKNKTPYKVIAKKYGVSVTPIQMIIKNQYLC